MQFEFATATRIVFGPGKAKEAGSVSKSLGRRALIVTGMRSQPARDLGLDGPVVQVSREPTVQMVSEAASRGRRDGCDCVVAVGGGSAIDAGKAIAALIPNTGDPLRYLEVIGEGRPLEVPPLPFVAIPTTAGTGSEVTRNAVLASPEHKVKASLRSPRMLPAVALVDPLLTLDMPQSITAATGLDAITQLLEPFVSTKASPLIDPLCLDGLRRASRALPRACRNGGDLDARTDMSLASLFGGLALANAGLGAVHGFAAPIGGMFDAPHGAVCAALLPHAISVNLSALRSRAPDSEAIGRYTRAARALTADDGAWAEDAAVWAERIVLELGVPSLRSYGITASDVPALCVKAAAASSMKSNAIGLTLGEMEELLLRAI